MHLVKLISSTVILWALCMLSTTWHLMQGPMKKPTQIHTWLGGRVFKALKGLDMPSFSVWHIQYWYKKEKRKIRIEKGREESCVSG